LSERIRSQGVAFYPIQVLVPLSPRFPQPRIERGPGPSVRPIEPHDVENASSAGRPIPYDATRGPNPNNDIIPGDPELTKAIHNRRLLAATALKSVATATGGRFFAIKADESLRVLMEQFRNVFKQIAAEMRVQYVLTLDSDTTSGLRIRTVQPKYNVRVQ
jgi:hypothetical protein